MCCLNAEEGMNRLATGLISGGASGCADIAAVVAPKHITEERNKGLDENTFPTPSLTTYRETKGTKGVCSVVEVVKPLFEARQNV